MKTRILLFNVMIGIFLSAIAQKPTITLTFTADNNGQHVPLNNILIENLTQGGDTTLFATDTILMLDYVSGTVENETLGDNVINVFQNYPNPMKGKTTISIYLQEKENILLTVNDIMGRQLLHKEYHLYRGRHSFTFYPGKESIYFFSVRSKHQIQTIKMLNSPSHTISSLNHRLDYNGQQSDLSEYKSENSLTNFTFNLGDNLKFTASTILGDRVLTASPSIDMTFYFHYTGDPCQDSPSVIDTDGNTYNTVKIGDQCWMKENLKTTTYRNGTSIPNVIDANEWSDLDTGAYVWHDNDISWKDKYGALYNWYAIADSNGLCPLGWHVPTHDEWTELTNYIGGASSPHANKLKSCRQVDSPLGGNCTTSEHPRWKESETIYGTDNYGFSALPGGYRNYYGTFKYFGSWGLWWTSTEYDMDFMAWYRQLYNFSGRMDEFYNMKEMGLSVRCIRD